MFPWARTSIGALNGHGLCCLRTQEPECLLYRIQQLEAVYEYYLSPRCLRDRQERITQSVLKLLRPWCMIIIINASQTFISWCGLTIWFTAAELSVSVPWYCLQLALLFHSWTLNSGYNCYCNLVALMMTSPEHDDWCLLMDEWMNKVAINKSRNLREQLRILC